MERISHYPRRDGKLPTGVKYVGRPSRWGNEYKLGDTGFVPVVGVDSEGDTFGSFATLQKLKTIDEVVNSYAISLALKLERDPRFLDPLREYQYLACACPLDQPCHADVLIQFIEGGA